MTLMFRTLLIVWPLKTTIICLSCVAGLVVFAKYSTCDPMSTKRIERFDQLFPLYVIQSFSFIPGFVGLFIAGVFSGSLRFANKCKSLLSSKSFKTFLTQFSVQSLRASTLCLRSLSRTLFVRFCRIRCPTLRPLLPSKLSPFSMAYCPLLWYYWLNRWEIYFRQQ